MGRVSPVATDKSRPKADFSKQLLLNRTQDLRKSVGNFPCSGLRQGAPFANQEIEKLLEAGLIGAPIMLIPRQIRSIIECLFSSGGVVRHVLGKGRAGSFE